MRPPSPFTHTWTMDGHVRFPYSTFLNLFSQFGGGGGGGGGKGGLVTTLEVSQKANASCHRSCPNNLSTETANVNLTFLVFDAHMDGLL